MRTMVAAALWLLLGVAAATAEEPDVRTPEPEIILALQTAVRTDEGLVCRASAFSGALLLQNEPADQPKAWFLKHYATVIGPELKAAVLAQEPEDYLKNYQGLMVGEGSRNIWFEEFGDPGRGCPVELRDHHYQQ